jgi:cob(I)alamin adenosyltransferase
MKIYTKTGDSGETGLFGGARVHKDSVRVNAYGSVDELNAAIGVAVGTAHPRQRSKLLEIQADLFALGAELACTPGKAHKLSSNLLQDADATRLEGWIDESEQGLTPLRNFVLPGGCAAAAQLHLARTVCRRAERDVLALDRSEPVRPEPRVYLNRLGDLLFVLARCENAEAGVADVPWNSRQ